MKILSILMAETPPSSPMYLRPYKVSWDDAYKDSLLESTGGGINLSAGAIGNVARSMLTPSAAHAGAAQIANGFGITRLTITMIVETDNIAGRSIQEVITGYSDRNGMHDNLGRAVYDPEMRFFFNSISNIAFQQGTGMNGYGSFQYTNSTQILTPLQGWDSNEQVPVMNRHAASMRPKDTLSMMSSGAFGGIDMSTLGNGAPVLGNTTYEFTNRPKRSSRDNNVSAEYLSRVFTGFRDSMLDANTDQRAFTNGLAAASESKYINEPLAADSSLLTLLIRRSAYQQEWSVTLKELKAIDPTIEQRIQPYKMDAKTRDYAASILSSTEGWHETSFEGQIAQMATTLLPNSMVKFALGMINFHAHSETVDGSTHVTLLDARGAAKGIDPRPLIGMITQHLRHEVYPVLTMGGKFNVYIEANISLNGLSTITVGVNGGIKKPFQVSSYCDSVFSPCLAGSAENLRGLSNDIGGLAAQLAAAAINNGPGIQRGNEQLGNISYGNGGVSAQPISSLNINPVAPGNFPGNPGGIGF